MASGRVVIFHRVGDVERVEALRAKSGEVTWRVDYPANYRGGVNSDTGPRCAPVVHDGAVYVFGAAGDLHCAALADGAKRWSRSLYEDYGGNEGFFGVGSTPIVIGERLLVNVGGRDGSGIVALDLKTGKTLWRATNEAASYSSPTSAAISGKTYALFVTRYNTIAVDPADGAVLFRFPFGKRGPTVNAATPLVFGDQLFVTSSYGVGAKVVRLGRDEQKTIWSSDKVISSQYATPVHQRGYLYGIDGREDIGGASLRCVDAATGKVVWSQAGLGVAHLILADDKLLILSVDGRLTLAAATPRGYQELAAAAISNASCRALPALAGGRLYFRDNRGERGELKCLLVGREPSKK